MVVLKSGNLRKRGLSYGEMLTSKALYVVLFVISITGFWIFMSRSFGDGSVAKWMMTTDQKTILADGKIGGTVAVGTVNLPTSARSAQAVYDAIREPGLSLATPVAGFAEGNAALVGLVGQKTAIPLTGMLTGGDSYRAGASDFWREDMEKPLRYLFARKKLSDSSSLLYFVGTGSVDGKEIWAYTTDENAEVDPGAVAEKTMWTVCRGPSCDFDADAMGDTAAIAGALAESASWRIRKTLVRSWTYVLTETLAVTGTGVTLEWEGTGATVLVGPAALDAVSWSSTGWTISKLTIDALSNVSGTAFSSESVSDVTVDGIRVLASSRTGALAIRFVWRFHSPLAAHSDPASAYSDYTGGVLASGNRITGSSFESALESDTVLLAFQSWAVFSGNRITGKLAYYMSKNGTVSGNTFRNSPSTALSVSTPVSSLSVSGNTFSNCLSDCVSVMPQSEDQVPEGIFSESLSFTGNTFAASVGYGILLSAGSGSATPVSFSWVTVESSAFSDIWKSSVRVSMDFPMSAFVGLTMSGNTVTGSGVGDVSSWPDSAFWISDRSTTDPLVQNVRSISITGNTVSNAPDRGGYGFRFEYPVLELPSYSGNSVSGYSLGEKNF